MTSDGANGREHILHAMVELSNQYPLLFLGPLTLGDVYTDANQPFRVSYRVISNEAARFDPSDLAARTNDAILCVIFASLFAERFAPEPLHLRNILRVHAGKTIAARYFDSTLREAVDCYIALGNLHDLCVGVIREATNETGLCRQGKLYVALFQHQLSFLALGDVSG